MPVLNTIKTQVLHKFKVKMSSFFDPTKKTVSRTLYVVAARNVKSYVSIINLEKRIDARNVKSYQILMRMWAILLSLKRLKTYKIMGSSIVGLHIALLQIQNSKYILSYKYTRLIRTDPVTLYVTAIDRDICTVFI